MADSEETESKAPKTRRRWFQTAGNLPVDERLMLKRSLVRRVASYLAALYLFAGGLFLVTAAIFQINANVESIPQNFMVAKDIYMAILPVASGVIAYWFASREGFIDAPTQQTRTGGPSSESSR